MAKDFNEKRFWVRIKDKLRHASFSGGEQCLVTQAELDSFGDKFIVLDKPPVAPRMGPQAEHEAPKPAPLKVTPTALARAEQEGIDLAEVQPTGARGRITLTDVKEYLSGIEDG